MKKSSKKVKYLKRNSENIRNIENKTDENYT